MIRITIMAAVCGLLSMFAVEAEAQSTSTTRSTTTTTQNGNTTTTVTRSTTVGAEVSVDEDRLGAALAGALIDRLDPEEARLRRLAEPARPEDAFGEWRVTDGGRDSGDCRFVMSARAGFLGARGATPQACPRRLSGLRHWTIQQGDLVFYTGGQEAKRLRFVEGAFIGGGLRMERLDDGVSAASH